MYKKPKILAMFSAEQSLNSPALAGNSFWMQLLEWTHELFKNFTRAWTSHPKKEKSIRVHRPFRIHRHHARLLSHQANLILIIFVKTQKKCLLKNIFYDLIVCWKAEKILWSKMIGNADRERCQCNFEIVRLNLSTLTTVLRTDLALDQHSTIISYSVA